MAESLAVEIPSDSDDPSPFPSRIRKRKNVRGEETSFLILDDDPTPQKPGPTSTPFFVLDTPLSNPSPSDSSIVKCTARFSKPTEEKLSGITGLICLESDNESENSFQRGSSKENENMTASFGVTDRSKTSFSKSASSLAGSYKNDYIGPCFPTELGAIGGGDSEHFQFLTKTGFVFEDKSAFGSVSLK
ncbi:crossover junction endonuclease EME1B-like [Tasmannia lanceolata]|uniref:crossover junction endonuclease EME1B-like n=1 Tax=Tasmannia lanceolata TaxID=3420 RepID=UPI00406356A0